MSCERLIGTFRILVHCAPDLDRQAESLLDKLQELNQRGPALKEGTTIEFGFSLLRLQRDAENLVVCEPDFEGDPLVDWIPQVDTTLQVLTEQVTLLRRVGLDGVTAHYHENIVIAKGCLKSEHVYLERNAPSGAHDSGWYMGNVEQPDRELTAEDLEVLPVYELMRQRPPLVKVLALPVGCLVVVRGEQIEAVLDEAGHNLWVG